VGELTALPDPIAGFRGLLLMGGDGPTFKGRDRSQLIREWEG